MILGIGTDICDITRIEKMIEKHGQRFIDKTFTANEQTYCEPKSSKGSSYAKRFAEARVYLSLSDDYPYASAYALIEAHKR